MTDNKPQGELALQTLAMPADTNPSGDIFGGWIVSQMDLAGAITATRVAQGRVVTIAIDSMVFHTPVKVGAVISCYTNVIKVGRSSIKMNIEVWQNQKVTFKSEKVTSGEFVFVAVNEDGSTKPVPQDTTP